MERMIQSQNEMDFDVWMESAGVVEMPYDIKRLGVIVQEPSQVATYPANLPLEVRCESSLPLSHHSHDAVWVASSGSQLAAWVPDLAPERRLLIELNQSTGPWLLANRDLLRPVLEWIVIHQPTHEKLKEAVSSDVRNVREFFEELSLPISLSGLPACLAPGTVLVDGVKRLSTALFDDGRLSVQGLAKRHVKEGYYAKSSRCQDCALNSECEGVHINMIRDQGLASLRPLSSKEALSIRNSRKQGLAKIEYGAQPQPAALSLDGGPPPKTSVIDPLSRMSFKSAKKPNAVK